jgi:hypothetical protein
MCVIIAVRFHTCNVLQFVYLIDKNLGIKKTKMSGKLTEFRIKETRGHDNLHINKNNVTGNLNAVEFQDADTKQFIIYFPALQISGYGETAEKAIELAKFSINEYFGYLNSLSPKKREIELRLNGWEFNKFRNKDFSKVYVDGEGELQNFNAVEGKVKHLTIEAA